MADKLVNKTFDEIEVGQSASRTKTVSSEDIVKFADVSGDHNPVHLSEEFAKGTMFGGRIAHGMLSGAYVSAVLGEDFPGPGTIYLSQLLEFRAPVKPGDEITTTVTVKEKIPGKKPGTGRLVLDTVCTNQDGVEVVRGEAKVIAPGQKLEVPRLETNVQVLGIS